MGRQYNWELVQAIGTPLS